jgi:DNA-binding NarL/FixJ family response regulator
VPRPTILLADDHAIVADGLRSLLSTDFDLVGVVRDGRSLLESAVRLKPEVIISDISMPLLNGLDAVRQLKKSGCSSKVIALTMHSEPDLASRAFRAGVSGYILKHAAGEELIEAIGEVLKGRIYLTPLIPKDLVSILIEARENTDADGALTDRQREVLQLIAEGKTMKEVAAILGISTRTAESHKYEMMETLGVKTIAELVQCAIRMKVVSL